MTDTFIEINDAAIKVLQNNSIVLRSPGYAVINNNRIYLGGEAVDMSRANPRMTYTHFWNNLNLEPLSSPSKLTRHHADLAYAHLSHIHQQIGKPDEVIFAVPSHYDEQHLSLLLGLAEAIPLRAAGLVDTAIAVAAVAAEAGPYYYLEIYLHHLTATRLEAGTEVVRNSAEVNDAVGLLEIYAKCADYIADLFIQQSRFDPLHNAATEQALHDRLPDSLASLCTRPEVTFELPFENAKYRIKLKRRQLVQILSPFYDRIIRALEPGINCLVSYRLSRLPGFTDALDDHIAVAEDTPFQGCRKNLSRIKSDDDALNFITRLPVTGAHASGNVNNVAASATETVAVDGPSHVLCNGKARALGPDPLYLSAGGDLSRVKTAHSHCAVDKSDQRVCIRAESELLIFKNGSEVRASVEVQSGDVITFAGSKIEYIFIEIVK